MKNIVLISLLILLGLNSHAQEYVPMAVEGAHWFVAERRESCPWPYENLWEYHVDGDTIFDGTSYRKIYRQQHESIDSGTYQPPFVPFGSKYLHGLLRDDTLAKKVYAVSFMYLIQSYDPCPLNEEYLLYDFSIEVGDTFDLCVSRYNYSLLYYLNTEVIFNVPSRSFEICDHYCDIYFWEGIGSTFGLFEPSWVFHDRDEWRTYLFNYCRTDDCSLLVSNPEFQSFEKTDWKLFPNPASDQLQFDLSSCSNRENKSISIFSAQGVRLKTFNLDDQQEVLKVDVKAFKPGLYFAVLTNDTEILGSKKFVVSK
jgi:Secretion system C-terminal sorting domain